MAYDYHGQWDKKTGHVAPMYSHPDDFDMNFNAVITITTVPVNPRSLLFLYERRPNKN